MEENRYGINWISLFIKVIIFVVVVLVAIWLISKLTTKDKVKGLSFEQNNKIFQNASVEYFKSNLPKENEKNSVTLNQLVSWDFLDELKNEEGKVCDARNSKSTIEAMEDYYNIKTILVCGNKTETNYIKLGNEECSNCDVKVEGLKTIKKEELKEEEKEETKKEETPNKNPNNSINVNESSKGPSVNNSNNTSSKPSNNNQSNSTTTNTSSDKPVLYEYVKNVVEYSDWYVGDVKGNNIENSTKDVSYSKYCKNEEYTYYTVSYTARVSSYSYKLELTNLNNVSSVKVKNDSYFNGYNDYQNYVTNKYKSLEMVGGATHSLPSATIIENASLTSNNFSYIVSNVYKENGKYYVDISIKTKTLNGIKPYYESNISKSIYYVPVKFTISYVDESNCVNDKTENSNNYTNYTVMNTWNEKINIYRHIITTKEYVYSNQTLLEGYTKTGKTKLAS